MVRPPTSNSAGRDELSMRLPDFAAVHPLALPRGRPQVMRLAIENRGREAAIRVHRRSFPSQQPLDRQGAMLGDTVLACGVRESITSLRHRLYHRARELPPGVCEV